MTLIGLIEAILEAMRMAIKMDEREQRKLVRMALLIIIVMAVWFAGAF